MGRVIEIECGNFDKCEKECGLVQTIKKHVEEYKMVGIELRCVSGITDCRVWIE